ncbi:hypothetical protein [Xanthomonas medicagonis]|uniref:hypothetical protein n=1 Tax=Xanthomonas medicagonis TaxID=3160841 RepID=UPI003513E0BA
MLQDDRATQATIASEFWQWWRRRAARDAIDLRAKAGAERRHDRGAPVAAGNGAAFASVSPVRHGGDEAAPPWRRIRARARRRGRDGATERRGIGRARVTSR